MSLKGKDLISVADLEVGEVEEILQLATAMKAEPEKHRQVLSGQTLAMVFEKPSLRTRVSFQTGMFQLGGHAIYLAPADISIGQRESTGDVANNLSRMTDGIMARTFAHDTVLQLAAGADVPVINGLSDLLHPCQSLADILTVQEHRGGLRGRKLAYLGDGNNVCHSLMNAGAKVGLSVIAVVPRGYEPDPSIVSAAAEAGRAQGAGIEVTHALEEGLAEADVVYTDVWASMGQEAESIARQKVFAPYQVSSRVFGLARPDAVFMHCLPAHRGEEVAAEVCDGPRSVIFDQAENRLHAQKAVLALLMG